LRGGCIIQFGAKRAKNVVLSSATGVVSSSRPKQKTERKVGMSTHTREKSMLKKPIRTKEEGEKKAAAGPLNAGTSRASVQKKSRQIRLKTGRGREGGREDLTLKTKNRRDGRGKRIID